MLIYLFDQFPYTLPVSLLPPSPVGIPALPLLGSEPQFWAPGTAPTWMPSVFSLPGFQNGPFGHPLYRNSPLSSQSLILILACECPSYSSEALTPASGHIFVHLPLFLLRFGHPELGVCFPFPPSGSDTHSCMGTSFLTLLRLHYSVLPLFLADALPTHPGSDPLHGTPTSSPV